MQIFQISMHVVSSGTAHLRSSQMCFWVVFVVFVVFLLECLKICRSFLIFCEGFMISNVSKWNSRNHDEPIGWSVLATDWYKSKMKTYANHKSLQTIWEPQNHDDTMMLLKWCAKRTNFLIFPGWCFFSIIASVACPAASALPIRVVEAASSPELREASWRVPTTGKECNKNTPKTSQP